MSYRWKLVKPYKYTKTTTLLAARKKQQLLQLQIWKKTYFWSIEVGWYKELEVKEFCHFDYIDLQLFNGLFQNNLKNICRRKQSYCTRV